MHAKRTAHLILSDLIALIMPGEQHKSWSSSLHNWFHYPVTSIYL